MVFTIFSIGYSFILLSYPYTAVYRLSLEKHIHSVPRLDGFYQLHHENICRPRSTNFLYLKHVNGELTDRDMLFLTRHRVELSVEVKISKLQLLAQVGISEQPSLNQAVWRTQRYIKQAEDRSIRPQDKLGLTKCLSYFKNELGWVERCFFIMVRI